MTNDTICPRCGKTNAYANEDGYVEGPREYHAECWAAEQAEQSKAYDRDTALPHRVQHPAWLAALAGGNNPCGICTDEHVIGNATLIRVYDDHYQGWTTASALEAALADLPADADYDDVWSALDTIGEDDALRIAVDHLDAEPGEGGDYVWHDDATGEDQIDAPDDLTVLGAALHLLPADSDAFSLWCAIPR